MRMPKEETSKILDAIHRSRALRAKSQRQREESQKVREEAERLLTVGEDLRRAELVRAETTKRSAQVRSRKHR